MATTLRIYTAVYCLLMLMHQVMVSVQNIQGKQFVLAFIENGSRSMPELIITKQRSKVTFIRVSFPLQSNLNDIDRTIGQDIDYVRIRLPVNCRSPAGLTSSNGIFINSSENIAIYGINHGNGTTDPFTVYPMESLGTFYIAATHNPDSFQQSNIAVVAAFNNTRIRATLPITHRPMTLQYNNKTYQQGDDIQILLDAYQTFNLGVEHDLTGLKIHSSSPVAVFTSDTYSVGGSFAQLDSLPVLSSTKKLEHFTSMRLNHWVNHYGEQSIPVQSWGRHFVAVPFTHRDAFSVVASEDKTSVLVLKRRSRSTYHLSTGEHTEVTVSSRDFIAITANNPVSIMQFSTTNHHYTIKQNSFISVVPSLEQCHNTPSVTFSSNMGIQNFFIITKSSQSHGITIDNILLSEQLDHFNVITTNVAVPGYNYTVIRILIRDNHQHTLKQTINADDTVSCVIAQGYTVQMNIANITNDLVNVHSGKFSTAKSWPKLVSSSSPIGYDILPKVSGHPSEPIIINKPIVNKAKTSQSNWETSATQSNHLGEGFNATVIAVIVSLATAVFFVIACIVGFVVAEFACGRESIFSGAKVSPIEQS